MNTPVLGCRENLGAGNDRDGVHRARKLGCRET